MRKGPRGGAQAHTPRQPLHLALHQVHRFIRVRQQAPGTFDQHLTHGGRTHLAPLAHQQWRTDVGLQVRDVQAHRGRRQVQRAGGFCEGAQVGDGDQRAQPVKIEFAHNVQ